MSSTDAGRYARMFITAIMCAKGPVPSDPTVLAVVEEMAKPMLTAATPAEREAHIANQLAELAGVAVAAIYLAADWGGIDRNECRERLFQYMAANGG